MNKKVEDMFVANEKDFEEYPKIIYNDKEKYMVHSKEEEDHLRKNVIKTSSKKSK